MSFSGMVNALSVAGAFLVVLSFKILSFSVLDILLCFGIVNIFVGIYMVRLLPIQTRRRVFRVVFKLLFHARIKGLENLKKAGDKALIITNHTSYLDVLLISTFIDRPIVFAVSDQLIDKTVFKFMTNLVDVRPLDPMSPFAVKAMVEELKKNQLCMIFTEGIIEGGNTRMKIYEGQLTTQNERFCIIISRFNDFIGSKLLSGAVDELKRHGVADENIDIVKVPGAFEIPLAAQKFASTGKYNALITLGAVIKGSTPHFDYVSAEVSKGVAQVGLKTGIPVIFGVLTTDNLEQAIERAGTKSGNKGADAAKTAIEMANLVRGLNE